MWRIRLAVVVSCLGPFQLGIGVVIVNTMLSRLAEDLGFDEKVGGAFASSAVLLGTIVGSLAACSFERRFGKYSQMGMGVLFTVGNFLCAISTDHKMCWGGGFRNCIPSIIVTGRFISGIGSGLAGIISPKFLTEMAPPEVRGALSAGAQTCAAFGAFVGLAIGLPFESDSFDIGYDWWRVMFLFACIPAILQVQLSLLTIPLFRLSNMELRLRFRSAMGLAEAKDAAQDMLWQVDQYATSDDSGQSSTVNNASDVPRSIQFAVEERDTDQSSITGIQKKYHRCVLLGIGVPVICSLSGSNVVTAYSTTIFEDAGFEHPIVGSLVMGACLMITAAISIILSDKLGRKTMAYLSFSGMGLSQLALALSDLAQPDVSGPLSVVFVLTYILSFGIGCLSLRRAYAPEVVPPELSGAVLGVGQTISLCAALLLVLFFPMLLESVGALWAFLILFALSVTSLLFAKVFMIETKGRELDDIVNELTRPS